MAYVVWGGATYAMSYVWEAALFLGAVTLVWLVSINAAQQVDTCDQPQCAYDYVLED